MKLTKRIIISGVLLPLLAACSATSLSCGTEDGGSWVNLDTATEISVVKARSLSELCGFSLDAETNTTTEAIQWPEEDFLKNNRELLGTKTLANSIRATTPKREAGAVGRDVPGAT